MSWTENLDFLNANTLRSFPIREGESAVSIDKNFTLPDDFVVDASMAVTSDVTTRLFISSILNYPEVVVVNVSDQNSVVVGAFTITLATHTQYTTYYLAPTESYLGANGKLVIANIENISNQPTGAFTFVIANTEFETRCVIPSVTGINRLVFVDETGTTQTLTGDVRIVAKNNLRFRKVGDAVFMDAGDGLGLNKDCSDELPCIRTIRSVSPDDQGNFVIVGADCAQFSNLSNPPGIMLDDICCKPCMGCNEVSELTTRAMQTEADMLKLRESVTEVETIIAQFTNTINFSCDC